MVSLETMFYNAYRYTEKFEGGWAVPFGSSYEKCAMWERDFALQDDIEMIRRKVVMLEALQKDGVLGNLCKEDAQALINLMQEHKMIKVS